MNIFQLILAACDESEKRLIKPCLRRAQAVLEVEATQAAYDRSPYAICLQNAKTKEDTHYQRRADALERHFALHPERPLPSNYGFQGWWDIRGCGSVPFQDKPQYRFRGQDLEISSELLARDRAAVKREAVQKRQAAWDRSRRVMQSNWQGALTRSLKSG